MISVHFVQKFHGITGDWTTSCITVDSSVTDLLYCFCRVRCLILLSCDSAVMLPDPRHPTFSTSCPTVNTVNLPDNKVTSIPQWFTVCSYKLHIFFTPFHWCCCCSNAFWGGHFSFWTSKKKKAKKQKLSFITLHKSFFTNGMKLSEFIQCWQSVSNHYTEYIFFTSIFCSLKKFDANVVLSLAAGFKTNKKNLHKYYMKVGRILSFE